MLIRFSRRIIISECQRDRSPLIGRRIVRIYGKRHLFPVAPHAMENHLLRNVWRKDCNRWRDSRNLRHKHTPTVVPRGREFIAANYLHRALTNYSNFAIKVASLTRHRRR